MNNPLPFLADPSAQGSSNSSISYNELLLSQGSAATPTNGAVAGLQAAPSGDAITGSTALQPASVEATTGVAVTPQADPVTGSAQGSPPPRQLYLVFLDGAAQGNAQALGLRIRNELGITRPDALFEHLNGFAVMLTADQAQRLQNSPGILSVEADTMVSLVTPINTESGTVKTSGTVSATAVQTTPYGVSMVWGRTNYSTAINSGKYAFVLDTGISTQTGDLNVNSTYSRNYTSTSRTDWIDYHGHGTHVAGTIAAINDGDGVVGVAAGANVISVRVLNRQGSGQTSWIVNGINHAVGLVRTDLVLRTISVNDLVANMSLGGGLNSTIDNAVRAAATPDSNGRYLRFALAAGNSGADADSYSPANTGDAANVYTVSAVDSASAMPSWSNYDNTGDAVDDVDYAAPGVGVISLGRTEGSLVTMSGTSMAAPAMAGVLLMGGPVTPQTTSIPYYGVAAADPLALLS